MELETAIWHALINVYMGADVLGQLHSIHVIWQRIMGSVDGESLSPRWFSEREQALDPFTVSSLITLQLYPRSRIAFIPLIL